MRKAGRQQIFIGHRIVAARLQALNPKGRPLTIVLASTYAPDSSRAIGEHEEFEVDKQRLYDSVKRHEILVEGTDANASIGILGKHDLKDAEQDRVLGLYGIPHVNSAGRSLHRLLGLNQLCVPTTFFRKAAVGNHPSAYTTWNHPARKSPYQLDQFITKQPDLKRVRDAGPWDRALQVLEGAMVAAANMCS
jgi:hypothetical protein